MNIIQSEVYMKGYQTIKVTSQIIILQSFFFSLRFSRPIKNFSVMKKRHRGGCDHKFRPTHGIMGHFLVRFFFLIPTSTVTRDLRF